MSIFAQIPHTFYTSIVLLIACYIEFRKKVGVVLPGFERGTLQLRSESVTTTAVALMGCEHLTKVTMQSKYYARIPTGFGGNKK